MIKSKTNDSPVVVGILGGGQLAKMLALEAYRLGLNVAVIEKGESPAGELTKFDFPKGWMDNDELDKFIEVSDIITLENEFIDTAILDYISQKKPVFPSSATMKKVQDKFKQKQIFSQYGIDVPAFSEIYSHKDAAAFGEKHGYPFLLKTRTLGYDGYGNFTVRSEGDIDAAFKNFTINGNLRPLLAEQFISFTKELAVMVCRNQTGETEVYPCVETIQKNHICHTVIAPAVIDESITRKAKKIALRCVEAIDGVGVFGIELFLKASGEVLVNEIAPRPHNSGHYTIEACHTSQYENALRAVLDLPLGSAEMKVPAAVMVNLLGVRDGSGLPTEISEMLKNNTAKLHLYGKKLSRNGRKMGHITAVGKTQAEALEIATKAANDLTW